MVFGMRPKIISSMTKEDSFDVVVIGGGSAGFSAAEQARALGASVCVIESGAWGGECPNTACVPTKTLLKSARAYYEAKNKLSELGVYTESVTFSWPKMLRRKTDVVDLITGEGKRLLKTAKMLGISTISGKAVFLDDHHISVGKRTIKAKSFVIATGTVDIIPSIEGIESIPYLTYQDAIRLKQLPRSMAIIGCGPVGCEFATLFSLLGVKVTLFQLAPRILNKDDEELSLLAQSELEKIGARILTSTAVSSFHRKGKRVELSYKEKKKRAEKQTVDAVLIAVGKRANIKGLHIDSAEVRLDANGFLAVNAALQTSKKHIFAAGDVTGGYMFTHTAHEGGVIAGINACSKSAQQMLKRDQRVVPRVTFIYPELASVGVTAQEAIEMGREVLVGRFPIGVLGRAVTDGHRIGLVKLVVDARSREILGGHILCERAGEMIHEVALAMSVHATVDEIARTLHAFPTYSEAIVGAAASV